MLGRCPPDLHLTPLHIEERPDLHVTLINSILDSRPPNPTHLQLNIV